MKSFIFHNSIPASKSLLNRALIVKSYFPALDVYGNSQCDDVIHMKNALNRLSDNSHLDCGEGGTTFRFLALRVARIKGIHTLRGHERLLQRPQNDLIDLLKQLDVQAKMSKSGFMMVSEGWKDLKNVIEVGATHSSQFASSLVLNSWLLPFDVRFKIKGEKLSESYFNMTLQMMQQLGMQIQKNENEYLIPAGQRLGNLQYRVESDLSSSFVFAAAGAMLGDVKILDFPEKSLQPDIAFLDIFTKMKIKYHMQNNILHVSKTANILPIDYNLGQSPDLFPVLAVLCSFAKGTSKLFGAPHLAHKESNRIKKVSDLLALAGIGHEILSDGMIIHGKPGHGHSTQILEFDPDQDHRMVMAAELLNKCGYNIHVKNKSCVNKSMPEFFDLFGVKK